MNIGTQTNSLVNHLYSRMTGVPRLQWSAWPPHPCRGPTATQLL